MWQRDQDRDVDLSRTRIGLGEPADGGGEAAPGAVVQAFAWAAGLPAGVAQELTRQAMSVANLRHPHVVQVLDAGLLGDGTPFVVMQRLPGWTLAERLRAVGALPLEVLLPIVRGVASALSGAHAAGLAHGAVCADHVFLADLPGYAQGFPELFGFGAARLVAAARAAGRIVREAAPGAVAPEQRAGAAPSAAADQFALAALAHRLLTGSDPRHPQGPGPAFQHVREEAAGGSGRLLAREAPAVEAVLARAMSWRPESRFGSVAAFFSAFEEAVVAASRQPAPQQPAQHRQAQQPPAPQPQAPQAQQPQAPQPQAPQAQAQQPVVAQQTAQPVAAPPAGPSLTQQFFAEGDRQTAEAEAAPAAGEDHDDPAALSAALARVPRRRGPVIAAVSLGAVLLVVLAGSIVWGLRDGARAPRAFDTDVLSGRPAPSLAAAPPAAPATPARNASQELRRTAGARPAPARLGPPAGRPVAPPALAPLPVLGSPPKAAATTTAQAQPPAPAAAGPAAVDPDDLSPEWPETPSLPPPDETQPPAKVNEEAQPPPEKVPAPPVTVEPEEAPAPAAP